MRYRNTQYGRWYLLVPGIVLYLLILDFFLPGKPIPWWTYLLVAGIVGGITLCFTSLTIYDGGDALVVQFGPIPLLRKRIPYKAITRVEKGRTTLLDGWGIHYRLGWGWTYNVWGFDCVRVFCGKKVYNLGTDDPDGLLAFLQEQISSRKTAEPTFDVVDAAGDSE